ncbi:Nif3-like dinuclear metal center hexameric protein [Buchnera aphidicola]|uniref:GTP cyclohydrolase 1 type 2 n=1 Tax=Buchnera aphidicola subsp. Tuberolachnus salignus TaxID=98804 RepID=A0A160SWU4_BUCTT|nr:Nif3-like dinuclear metal center hexameric protein [Buchnera aphidicola]CUR53170.1 Putative GTP cyclohydrolase 1 type 2 [Buchnera aphidicola (Tuberolachnus salignus)]
MNNFILEKLINKKLIGKKKILDIVPNGLQIEGKSEVIKIITGVSICQKLLNIAIAKKADAIIVHHGFFWNNEEKVILGIKRKRIKNILKHNINLYSWHLPLDIHKKIGNNVLFASNLNIKIKGNILPEVLWGEFENPIPYSILIEKIKKIFHRTPFHYGETAPNLIKRVAWCTGKGQKFLINSTKKNIDAFFTGEISEENIHVSFENKIHFFSLGHHATEIAGIKTLTKWLKKKNTKFDLEFVNIFNPI